MILAAWRAVTSKEHLALEEQLEILDPKFSKEKYVELLLAFLSFYIPLETELEAIAENSKAARFYLENRRKAPLLRKDLKVLAGELSNLQRWMNFPSHFFSTEESVLGLMYVVEGSTLGGKVIEKSLSKTLGLSPEKGLNFFSCYGENTRERWKEFLSFAESFSFSEQQISVSAQSALETFRILRQGLPKRSVIP